MSIQCTETCVFSPVLPGTVVDVVGAGSAEWRGGEGSNWLVRYFYVFPLFCKTTRSNPDKALWSQPASFQDKILPAISEIMMPKYAKCQQWGICGTFKVGSSASKLLWKADICLMQRCSEHRWVSVMPLHLATCTSCLDTSHGEANVIWGRFWKLFVSIFAVGRFACGREWNVYDSVLGLKYTNTLIRFQLVSCKFADSPETLTFPEPWKTEWDSRALTGSVARRKSLILCLSFCSFLNSFLNSFLFLSFCSCFCVLLCVFCSFLLRFSLLSFAKASISLDATSWSLGSPNS